MLSFPGLQKMRMRRSIASSDPTPQKMLAGVMSFPLSFDNFSFTANWYGSG